MGTRIHVTWQEAVRRLARGCWGREYSNRTDAERELVEKGVSVADAAALEILRLMQKFAEACREETPKPKEPHGRKSAATFPGVNVGDRLYCGNEDELKEYIVIAVANERCAVVELPRDPPRGEMVVWWADDSYYRDKASAVRAKCLANIDYARSQFREMESALEAVELGQDLDRFFESLRY